MNRREFIAGCGAVTATATAGCLDSVPGIGSDGPSTDTPAGVVEAYINAQEKLYDDPESGQERIAELTHSQAPNQPTVEQAATFAENGDLNVTSINGINTRLRDISAAQMRSLASVEFRDQPLLDSSGIETFATAETALVDASYDTEGEFEANGNTQSFENTNNARYLVAVEDEEWRVVFQRRVPNQ